MNYFVLEKLQEVRQAEMLAEAQCHRLAKKVRASGMPKTRQIIEWVANLFGRNSLQQGGVGSNSSTVPQITELQCCTQ